MSEQDWFEGQWFLTHTGKQFRPLVPRAQDVTLLDIAHALSNVCRYGGHVREFYSVAQHSVHVARIVQEPELQLHALMHDAAEAYCGDVIRPLKVCLPEYKPIERRIEAVILEAFGMRELTSSEKRTIKDADLVALVTERRDLCAYAPGDRAWNEDALGIQPDPVELKPLSPHAAESVFLNTFFELRGRAI